MALLPGVNQAPPSLLPPSLHPGMARVSGKSDQGKGPSRLEAYSSAEDTEDDNMSATLTGRDSAPDNIKSADGKKSEVKEEITLQLEKKRAVKRRFTEEVLLTPYGLDRVRESFPKNCRFRGRGYEVCQFRVNCCFHHSGLFGV